jgi:putative transposase
MKKRHSASFKAKVALEAAKEEKTMAQLSSKFGIHRVQIQDWKKTLLGELPKLFSVKGNNTKERQEKLIEELYSQIGRLKMENEWLKKKSEIVS